jgi:hypothetical protein
MKFSLKSLYQRFLPLYLVLSILLAQTSALAHEHQPDADSPTFCELCLHQCSKTLPPSPGDSHPPKHTVAQFSVLVFTPAIQSFANNGYLSRAPPRT